VRTFYTGYDRDGIIVEVGKSDISRIYRLCNSYDKLQSKWSQPEINHRKRYRCKRAGKQQNGPAKITILYFHPNSKPRRWFLEVAGKSTQRLLEKCLFGVTTDSRRN
jgi:hypothetical protein